MRVDRTRVRRQRHGAIHAADIDCTGVGVELQISVGRQSYVEINSVRTEEIAVTALHRRRNTIATVPILNGRGIAERRSMLNCLNRNRTYIACMHSNGASSVVDYQRRQPGNRILMCLSTEIQ